MGRRSVSSSEQSEHRQSYRLLLRVHEWCWRVLQRELDLRVVPEGQ